MQQADSLLRTKLRLPFTRQGPVSRPRLQDQIAQGLCGPLTLITAPAGFGKTTLIASSVTASGMPVAWLSLDKNDNQTGRFLSYLIAGLQEADRTIGGEAAGLRAAAWQAPDEAILTQRGRHMKKITVFVGSARTGNTYRSAAQFLNNLQAMGGIEYEIVRLSDYHLQPCRGCRLCFDRGEEHCPAKDDRDVLIEKMKASDGLVFATPNYSFGVSAHMKLFLDRLAFVFHRPQFYGKTYTSIVTQGIGRGDKIVDYLDFVGMALCCNTVKGSCLTMLLPMTDKEERKVDHVLAAHARRYYARLEQPAYPVPSLFKLAIFRFGRTKMRIEREQDSRDYAYYADKGWFESDYWYPTRLGVLQKGVGTLIDSLAASMSSPR